MGTINTDVVVYGATAAGIVAAKAIADAGYKVSLVNPYAAHYGGMFTGGLSAIDFGPNGTLVSIVGGYTKQLLESINTIYGLAVNTLPKPEPHGALIPINAMRTTTGITTQPSEILASLVKTGTRITSITTQSNTYNATIFIDATYEGDLMAMSGVSCTIGREAARVYNENVTGAGSGGLAGFGSEVQNQAINVLDSNGQRLVNTGPLPKATVAVGDAYQSVQSPTFRVCLTSTTAKKQAFAMPAGYNANDYATLGNWLIANSGTVVKLVGAIGGTDCVLAGTQLASNSASLKFDCNSIGLVSSDFLNSGLGYSNMVYAYLTGNATTRTAVKTAIYKWVAGLLYFVANDASLSGLAVQTDAASYALCNDEFQTDFFGVAGFPPQLYLREGRRLVGQYVMKLADVQSGANQIDSIAKYNYSVDLHSAQRYVRPTNAAQTTSEGGFHYASPALPYHISWRSLLPVAGQADNLIVPVCLSSTHLAWGALRLEMVGMLCGEAAGQGAVSALLSGVDPVNLPVYKVQARLLANNGKL